MPLYALGLALFLCALLSKTATCLLPVALLLVIVWKRGRPRRGDLAALAPLVIVGTGLVLMTVLLESHHRAHGEGFSLSPIERCLVAGRSVWFYAAKLVWPVALSIVYPRWVIDAGAWWHYLFPLALVVVLAALWRRRHRIGRGAIAGAAFYVIALVPISFVNVAFARYAYVADHWQYWASMGLIALLVAAFVVLTRIERRPGVARLGAVGVLAVLSGLTWQRAGVFESPTTMWQDAVRHNPGSPMTQYNLAVSLHAEGRIEAAVHHYREVVRIDREHPLAHNNLGIALRSLGKDTDAIHHYREAVRLAPDFAKANANLGDLLRSRGITDEAIECYRAALRVDPDFAGAHYGLAIALRNEGRLEEAITHYRAVVRLAPRSAEGHIELGETLAEHGELDEAVGHYREALRIDPDSVAARRRLTMAGE